MRLFLIAPSLAVAATLSMGSAYAGCLCHTTTMTYCAADTQSCNRNGGTCQGNCKVNDEPPGRIASNDVSKPAGHSERNRLIRFQ